MKKTFLLLIPIVILGCKSHFYMDQNEKWLPGVVRINDTLFVDQTEIRNVDYREFVYWNSVVYPDKRISLLPDTLVWRTEQGDMDDYIELYYRHPAYSDYPVVGISYDQALKYCRWRSDRVMEMLLMKEGIIKEDSTFSFSIARYFEGKIDGVIPNYNFPYPQYSLPSKEEWNLYAALKTDTLTPFKNSKIGFDLAEENWRNKLKYDSCQFATKIEQQLDSIYISHFSCYAMISPDITHSVSIGHKNDYGLFHTVGNVSEITKIKGVAVGGNWEVPLNEIDLSNTTKYSGAQHWLGFRCVATWKKWKSN